jgi:hypothetical protein
MSCLLFCFSHFAEKRGRSYSPENGPKAEDQTELATLVQPKVKRSKGEGVMVKSSIFCYPPGSVSYYLLPSSGVISYRLLTHRVLSARGLGSHSVSVFPETNNRQKIIR